MDNVICEPFSRWPRSWYDLFVSRENEPFADLSEWNDFHRRMSNARQARHEHPQ
jgi:hypothetical protein